MSETLAFEPYNFEEGIKLKLQERYPQSVISIVDVRKNNGVILRALAIRKPDSNVSRTIYIDGFRELYEKTHDMDEICNTIAAMNEEGKMDNFDVNLLFDFENIKGRICVKLVNWKKNEQALENIPHRQFLDLAIVYYIRVYTPAGASTVLIRNEMMKWWKVKEEELYSLALKNMQELSPVCLMSMNQLIKNMLADTGSTDEETGEDMFAERDEELYVATNIQKSLGAAVILYPQFLEEVADDFKSSFYILPSSVHEVLILPDKCMNTSEEELLEMVQTINATDVRDEEVLADNVYYYDKESKEIKALF